MRNYVVEKSDGSARDVVADSGEERLVVTKASGIRFAAGTWHELEAGLYHATPVSPRTLCATLAVLSPRVSEKQDVLLGKPGFMQGAYMRSTVSADETLMICAQLSALLRPSELDYMT